MNTGRSPCFRQEVLDFICWYVLNLGHLFARGRRVDLFFITGEHLKLVVLVFEKTVRTTSRRVGSVVIVRTPWLYRVKRGRLVLEGIVFPIVSNGKMV
jgi:hypothetical protein